MTEADIQAAEAKARPERETTQAIARRVLGMREGEPVSIENAVTRLMAEVLLTGERRHDIARGLAELLRRAAADPEPR